MTQQPIQTTAYWDQAADGYIAGAEPFTGLFCRDAVALADVLVVMTLLDIATGPGALAVAAAEVGARVTAIDFSQTMLERVTARSDDPAARGRRCRGCSSRG
ncbi:MAG: methyltransferase domain-containing protein [Sphingomonadales bacterium]|nr:MAG: methyltransferase domain-containing protein [Sphingomonadales bacterium]